MNAVNVAPMAGHGLEQENSSHCCIREKTSIVTQVTAIILSSGALNIDTDTDTDIISNLILGSAIRPIEAERITGVRHPCIAPHCFVSGFF